MAMLMIALLLQSVLWLSGGVAAVPEGQGVCKTGSCIAGTALLQLSSSSQKVTFPASLLSGWHRRQTTRFLSWNVYYANNLLGRASEIASAIATIDPEIVSLQELWREKDRILEELNRQTSGKTWEFARGGETEVTWDGDILYRSDLWQHVESGMRAYGDRGISWAVLRRYSDGAGVLAAGTHPWCCTNDEPILRTVQDEIVPLIRELRARFPGYPVALMGDMNANFYASSQALLREGQRNSHNRDWSIQPYSFEDSYNIDGQNPDSNTGFGPKIDFVYFEKTPLRLGDVVSSQIWYNIPNNAGSDHFAVSGDVMLLAGEAPINPPSTTVAPPAGSTVAPPAGSTVAPPAGPSSWQHHLARNCYQGAGAQSATAADALVGSYTLAECKAECEQIPACEAIVMRDFVRDGRSGTCWLRKNVNLDQCIKNYFDFDTYTLRRSSTSLTPTMPPSSTSTKPSGGGTSRFEAVDGGDNRACRGENSDNNSDAYFTVHSSVASLDACKAICMIQVACQGIEYWSKGKRCEVWTRSGGIGATKSAQGFMCLRYSPTDPAAGTDLFELVDGGENKACRGANSNDNSNAYFAVYSAASLDACKAKCVITEACKGIEYMSSSKRCEVWIRSGGIGATKSVSGFTCLRYVPISISTTPITPTNPACDAFSVWPHVDGGVTCGSDSCTALVLTQPYGGRCDVYCESFGHVCAVAAEEVDENCEVKEHVQCDEEIAGTSDMLCTCHSARLQA